MGLITGAKMLTSASPTMDSPVISNLTTTTLTSAGKVTSTLATTGYFIQRTTYPADVTSTVVVNPICTANTVLFLQPIGWSISGAALTANGSCVPYPSLDCCTSGSFTLSSGSISGTVLPLDVVLVNY